MDSNEPVVRRLQILLFDYMLFSKDRNARMLCWHLQPDEIRMADAFLAMEEDEQTGQTGDIFFRLQTPFKNSSVHGYSLQQELISWYEAEKENLAAAGLDSNWIPPQADAAEGNIAFLVKTLLSFQKHYIIKGRVVMALRPTMVGQPEDYAQWLSATALASPESVRILLADNAVNPGLAALAAMDGKHIWIRKPDLDMSTALEELSIAAGNLDKPGGQFRHLFVKLTNALKVQDLGIAHALSDKAVKLAAAQKWHYLAVPVHMALAGGLINAGQHKEAVVQYKAAETAAALGETDGIEEARASCPQLRLQARMGCGSALIAAGDWKRAAQQFAETAPLAAEQGNLRTELDCCRLASFCYEQDGDIDKAFQNGELGIQTARKMDKETRETSTFAYLGEAMMRLCQQKETCRSAASRIEQEIIKIAGTRDWQPKQAQEVIS